MRQIFHPYWKWECYQNGMWRKESKEYEQSNILDIIKFTSDNIAYGESMLLAVKSWVYSCENFLSNRSINRMAYIGHAGACIANGFPEYLVRKAWSFLTDEQRYKANIKASKAIKTWEHQTRFLNTLLIGKGNAIQMEFQMK